MAERTAAQKAMQRRNFAIFYLKGVLRIIKTQKWVKLLGEPAQALEDAALILLAEVKLLRDK